MGAAPGRIGFMSTQKRESRSKPAGQLIRGGDWRCRQRQRCADREGAKALIARYVCAGADGGTAPIRSALRSMWMWMATIFLRADQLPGNFARPVFVAELSGSPPTPVCPPRRAPRLSAYGRPASPRSSLPPVPFPSGLARLYRNLPQAPAAYRRRAERYDGQGNLYFVHAA